MGDKIIMNMKDNCFWRFISNQHSTINGINDAGIETFTANIVHSLVRETIQNSLDAQLDSTKPVIVEFNQFLLEYNKFPDYMNFKRIINKCFDSNNDELDAKAFFKNALKIISEPLNVMRISDYNTYGLIGADKCEKGSPWSRLVKENGSSNKGQTSGGSFGIGKSAAFACSDLRTVFYSSVDKFSIESNIGVARLISYFDDILDSWTTGIGYYSDNDKLTAIREQVHFDSNYERKESGTDVYIIGFSKWDNLYKEIIISILENFLVSLWKNNLEVIVDGKIINKYTMGSYIDNLNPYESKSIKEIIDYYYLLTSSDSKILKILLDNSEYGKSYGFNNKECTLYLVEGQNLNSRIMMTRKAGMKLFNQDYISGSIDFTGILMIEGRNMNEFFRMMEVPSHDAWEPGRCKGKEKFADKVYSELRKYLKNKVKDSFGKTNNTQLDAFGASDFLPDKITNEDSSSIVKEKLMDKIKNIIGKEMKPKKKPTRKVEVLQGADEGKKAKPNENKNKKRKNSENIGETTGEKGFKYYDINERIICRDKENGIYTIKYIVPNNTKVARLDFFINGEQSNYDFPVKEAYVKNGKAIVKKITDNRIYLENVCKSDLIKIDLKLDFNQYCLMEANYYESKK
jgi:hypothetical protein